MITIPAYVLIAISVLAAVALVGLVAEEINRREWRRHDQILAERVAADELLLEQLRGPRRSPDADDPTRRL